MVCDLEGFVTEIGGQICQEKLLHAVAEVQRRCCESPERGFKPVLECGVAQCVCVRVCLSLCFCVCIYVYLCVSQRVCVYIFLEDKAPDLNLGRFQAKRSMNKGTEAAGATQSPRNWAVRWGSQETRQEKWVGQATPRVNPVMEWSPEKQGKDMVTLAYWRHCSGGSLETRMMGGQGCRWDAEVGLQGKQSKREAIRAQIAVGREEGEKASHHPAIPDPTDTAISPSQPPLYPCQPFPSSSWPGAHPGF